MATKTVNIEAVGAGQTSATFTTSKEGLDDVSLDIKIRVKKDGKVEEWLVISPIVVMSSDNDYSPQYPISVFRGDKIIIEQENYPFNTDSTHRNVTFLSVQRNAFNDDQRKIKKSNGTTVGRFVRLDGYYEDYSEDYQNYVLHKTGNNNLNGSKLPYPKRAFWLVFDDSINENETIKVTLTSLWTDEPSRYYGPFIIFDYHGDMTRDEAITAGVKILDGNTDPNV